MSTEASETAKELRDQANAILTDVRSLDVSKWSMHDVLAELERHQVAIGETLLAIASCELLPRDMTDVIYQEACKWNAWKAQEATRKSQEMIRGETRRPVSELARHRRNEKFWFVCFLFTDSLLRRARVASGSQIANPTHVHVTEAYREHARFERRKLELRRFCVKLDRLIDWAEHAIEEPLSNGDGSVSLSGEVPPTETDPFTLHCIRMEAGGKPGKPVTHRDIAKRWLKLHPDDDRTEEQVKRASEANRARRKKGKTA